MDDQRIALVVLAVACALIGMLVGWMGGVAEGREKERAERRQRMHTPGAPANCPACRADRSVRECCNAECGWKGRTARMCGAVGPLCPECGEVTEPAGVKGCGE